MFFKILYNIFLFPIFFLYPWFYAFLIESSSMESKEDLNQKNLKRFSRPMSKRSNLLVSCGLFSEYEQIKPVLSGLKEIEPNAVFILSFFSPSDMNM